MANNVLIRRVLDSYDSVSEILEAAEYDLWDLIDVLIEWGYINENTMPHIFDSETMEYYDEDDD